MPNTCPKRKARSSDRAFSLVEMIGFEPTTSALQGRSRVFQLYRDVPQKAYGIECFTLNTNECFPLVFGHGREFHAQFMPNIRGSGRRDNHGAP